MENLGYLSREEDLPHAVSYGERHRFRARSSERMRPSRGYYFAKRCMGIIGSLCALAVLAVPMLVIALLIFLQDFHNPFFRQVRVTKDGRYFYMYKFRTMCVDAEQKLDALKQRNEADGPVFKMKDDPRVTKLGKFLRKMSLDELPQFLNVLGGSMSLVGPRPPIPREVEQYTPYQNHRLDVKGGLTCYWQCSGRSNIMFDEWVELDLRYIREQSLKTDVKILWKTARAVLQGDGAE